MTKAEREVLAKMKAGDPIEYHPQLMNTPVYLDGNSRISWSLFATLRHKRWIAVDPERSARDTATWYDITDAGRVALLEEE